jgi:hypothetical protein
MTSDITKAKTCALRSLEEMTALLESGGNFDRAMAYLGLGLATATGTALVHKASEDLIENLAIAAGGLIGLNSVIDTNGQKKILKKAVAHLTCIVSTADSIIETDPIKVRAAVGAVPKTYLQVGALGLATPQEPLTVYSPETELSDLQSDSAFQALDGGVQNMQVMMTTQDSSQLWATVQETSKVLQVLDATHAGLGRKVSDAVIAIRAEVREGLSEVGPSLEDILKNQRNRVVDMAGEFMRARADLKKKRADPPSGPKPQSVGLVMGMADAVITTTKPIADSFENCVDPATQRGIEGS